MRMGRNFKKKYGVKIIENCDCKTEAQTMGSPAFLLPENIGSTVDYMRRKVRH